MKHIQYVAFIACSLWLFYILFHVNIFHFRTINYNVNILFRDNVSRNHWLILTSIVQLEQYLTAPLSNMSVIVIGKPSPSNLSLSKNNIIFVHSKLQSQYRFRSKHPKVIAYLLAIANGARFIYEYNSPISFNYHQHIKHIAFRRQRSPFINIYPTFTANFTDYAPGLPKDELLNITQDGWSSIRTVDSYQETINPFIQQQISIHYEDERLLVNHPPVAIEPFTFTPFSSENILFTYDAFWGLILFETKSDIWRSWWVQRLLWDINGHVSFASSAYKINTTMMASNNSNNNNMKNVIEDENIGKLVQYLSTWKSTEKTLMERIKQLIANMVQEGFCKATELKVIEDWLYDLQQIKYVLPSVKNVSLEQTTTVPIRHRRTAVCLTGLIECIEAAWKRTAHEIRTHIQGEIDIFMYLSSTEPIVDQLPTVPLKMRIIEALRYPNFTVKVLFENIPKLDPHFPPNCTSDASVNQPGHKIPRYYQQLFGLSNCFSLVQDYSKKHNIKYDLMVRSRADIEFLRIPSTFERPSPNDINTTLIIPPNRYGSPVDDGFAIGPIDSLEVYMNRYYSFQTCLTRDLHPERYLHFYLTHRHVKMNIDKDTLVGHIPHSSNNCH